MIKASASITIPVDHPALAGHFPARPLVPGVLWLAEVTAIARNRLGFQPGPCCWRRVRFTRAVAPNTPVHLTLSGDDQAFSFQIRTADGESVAKGKCHHGALE